MSGAEREDEPCLVIRTPPLDDLDDPAKKMLLGCYRLLLEIAEREGIEVWPPVSSTTPTPTPKPPRTRRPSPSRLAKWEAHWQAEQNTEGER